MSFFLFALLVLGVEDEPLIVVENVAEAGRLDGDSTRVQVVLRDHETLQKVLEKAPNIRSLVVNHPGNKMPLESIQLLARFKKLEKFHLHGDPFLSDDKFKELGKLHHLKSLKMALP
tara:strand:+ start:2035 stop:2385 length:351 start_codon:yes stop_codon:yes gene_type:complete